MTNIFEGRLQMDLFVKRLAKSTLVIFSVLALFPIKSMAFGAVYVGPIPNSDFKHGRVMARSVVLNPETGEPYIVEFDSSGEELSEVPVDEEKTSELLILQAESYRFYEQQLEEFESAYEETLAKGAELYTRREYEQATFTLADNQTVVSKKSLSEGINSVLVRGQVNRLVNDPEQLVLFSFPFDMTQTTAVFSTDTSLVVNDDGQILYSSSNRIGYRTGFFGDATEPQNERGYRVEQDDKVFGPLDSVKVYVSEEAYRAGVAATDEDGKYAFRFFMPPCPIGGFSYTTDVWAELRYKSFLPTGSPTIPYYLRTPGYSYCFAQLVPPLIAPAIIAIQASQAVPNFQSNLYADVMFVTGRLVLESLNGSSVNIGETTRTSFEEDAENVVQEYYDFNNDGQFDTSVLGQVFECVNEEINDQKDIFVEGVTQGGSVLADYECTLVEQGSDVSNPDNLVQGIFLDGQQDNPEDFPDILRIVDQELRDEPIGLLDEISTDDLRNTDVYFFRESTGQLILERRGLKEDEAENRPEVEYDEEENQIAYRIMLRGVYDSPLNIGGGVRRSQSFEDWATEYQLAEPLRSRESDQPKPGEFIKIVAINRATGYTGTTSVMLETLGGGDIGITAPTIYLTPPNLKIWAERSYEVERGLTEGEERKYLIGSEGAALNSDKTITIYSEWLDEDGQPLPEELGLDDGEQYGLTGRLAKVAGNNRLLGASGSAGVAEFPVGPGRKTQVLRVNASSTSGEHFYLHVIGKAMDQECVNDSSCPDFHTLGDDASYDSRPELLTPFLVPLFDENTSWQEYSVYRDLRKKANDPGNTTGVLDPVKPLPSYVWQYRPEYQFSQFALEIQEINRTQSSQEGETPTITNILDSDKPVIGSSDELLSVLYSLISSDFERLEPIDGPQELVLALGETEQLITFGEDQTISFSDLNSLSVLDVEDFLTMRLYANNDAGNILWEYAFEFLNYYALLDDDILPNDDGAIEISADEPEIGLIANLIGFASRDDDKKYNVVIRWLLEGEGSLEKTQDSDDDVAIFRNSLTLSNEAGTNSKVSARLIDTTSGETQDVPLYFTVVPGLPAEIEAYAEGAIGVDGAGQTVIRGVAKDAWGNTVADGTSVTPITGAAIRIKEHPEATENGAFSFVIEGTDFAELSSIGIRIGNEETEIPVDVQPVNISIEGLATTTTVNQRHEFTVRASSGGRALPNYSMDIWATRARLDKSTVVTDANGVATVILYTPPAPEDIEIKAMAGLQTPFTHSMRVEYPENETPAINNTRAKMVGDLDTAQAFSFERWDQTAFTTNKEVQGYLEVMGTPGESLSLSLGDIFEPNNLIQAAYWMNAVDEGLKDEVGYSRGTLENITAANDSMMQADNSFKFKQLRDDQGEITQHSRVKVSNASRFQLRNDFSFRVNVKADEYGGEIVNLGNGLVLSLQSTGELLAQITTDQEVQSVSIPNFPLGEWSKVAVAYKDNKLTLAVGGLRAEVVVTGEVQYSAIEIHRFDQDGVIVHTYSYGMVAGQGFDGYLDCLKWYDLSSRPLIAFDDGLLDKDVVVGEQGRTQVAINSLGRLHSFGSKLSMQAITAITARGAAPVTLISAAMYESLVQASASAGIIDGIPEYSQDYLNDVSTDELAGTTLNYNFYQNALFPNAYAYDIGFFDVVGIVSMLIGLDSLQIIWEQVGNLLMGRDVDYVSLTIAILDVLALFPPAAPLKAVTVPAKLAVKLLRIGNTKAVKYLGGVMKKMFQKAKGRDFSLVFQGIAFVIIVADMAKDEEGRQAISDLAKMINSTDDFLDVIEFASLGDDEISPGDSDTASLFYDDLKQNKGRFVFEHAFAKVPVGLGLRFTKALKEAAPIIRRSKNAGTKGMGEYARAVRKLQREAVTDAQKRAATRIAKAGFDKDTFKGIIGIAGRGGIQKIRNVLTCRYPGQRNSPLLMLGLIGYLEAELFIPPTPSDVPGEEGDPGQDGSLFAVLKGEGDEKEYTRQIVEFQKLVISSIPGFCHASSGKNENALVSQAHGKAFQLMQLAILHLGGATVAGVEVKRNVFLFSDDSAFADGELDYRKAYSFGRDVDVLVVDDNGAEIWHEQKSWVAKVGTKELSTGVGAWTWGSGKNKSANFKEFDKKLKGNAAHRQFILDHVADELGATERAVRRPRATDEFIDVHSFEWSFQRFNVKLKTKPNRNSPSKANMRKAFKKLPTKTTLFEEHSGVSHVDQLKVSRINEGSLISLLGAFEQDFKVQMLAELKDSGVELIIESP